MGAEQQRYCRIPLPFSLSEGKQCRSRDSVVHTDHSLVGLSGKVLNGLQGVGRAEEADSRLSFQEQLPRVTRQDRATRGAAAANRSLPAQAGAPCLPLPEQDPLQAWPRLSG